MRDRLHKLEGSEKLTSAAVREVTNRVGHLEPRVAALEESDKIDRAVKKVRDELRGDLFTTTQKVGAALVGLAAIADFVRGWFAG